MVFRKFEKNDRGQQESNQRPQDLQSYALPLSYDPDSAGDQTCFCLSLAVFATKGGTPPCVWAGVCTAHGALAQSEECVLCKHEVRGSKPRCSNAFFLVQFSVWPGTRGQLLKTFWKTSVRTEWTFFGVCQASGAKKAGSMGELNPRPLAP